MNFHDGITDEWREITTSFVCLLRKDRFYPIRCAEISFRNVVNSVYLGSSSKFRPFILVRCAEEDSDIRSTPSPDLPEDEITADDQQKVIILRGLFQGKGGEGGNMSFEEKEGEGKYDDPNLCSISWYQRGYPFSSLWKENYQTR